jgi:hypothetical protein
MKNERVVFQSESQSEETKEFTFQQAISSVKERRLNEIIYESNQDNRYIAHSEDEVKKKEAELDNKFAQEILDRSCKIGNLTIHFSGVAHVLETLILHAEALEQAIKDADLVFLEAIDLVLEERDQNEWEFIPAGIEGLAFFDYLMLVAASHNKQVLTADPAYSGAAQRGRRLFLPTAIGATASAAMTAGDFFSERGVSRRTFLKGSAALGLAGAATFMDDVYMATGEWRNIAIAHALQEIARKSTTEKTVSVIYGAGHVPRVLEFLENPDMLQRASRDLINQLSNTFYPTHLQAFQFKRNLEGDFSSDPGSARYRDLGEWKKALDIKI